MSYDLRLFPPVDGEDPETTYERLNEEEEQDPDPGTIVEASEARKKKLADALKQARPALEAFSFDYQKIAASNGISEDDARRKWRHIELNEEALTLQIILYDECASIAITHGFQGDEAASCIRAVWRCAEILQQQGGYCAFDPQLGKLLDLAADYESVLGAYNEVTPLLAKIQQGSKPWWKFW